MAGITHSKVSEIEDGADETLIRPSDWNSAHAVASGTSFPTDPAPAEKDLFYRTDEHMFYIYNGSDWVELTITGHNASILSTTTHNNNNLFSGYGAETVATLRGGYLKVPSLTAISDPASMILTTDWYGASGAYIQADADSDATHIEDDGAGFPDSIKYTLVKWASNALGTLNTGVGIITTVDTNTLTIVKCSGANFAANYYYWIKHSELTIPITGFYLVTGSVLFLPAEADKHFQVRIMECNGTAAPTTLASSDLMASIADYAQPIGSWFIPLTATRTIYLLSNGIYTLGTPTLYYSAPSHNPLNIFLLKQTA